MLLHVYICDREVTSKITIEIITVTIVIITNYIIIKCYVTIPTVTATVTVAMTITKVSGTNNSNIINQKQRS